ncbi:MAG: VanZ family protein [Candidatus Omnitrophica bacterium]|nr:VanZ family protein [Candidatus Omnitrophota bacterium]
MAVAKNNSAIFFIKYWLPAIIYSIIIFYISSQPGNQLPDLFLGQDIIFHIIEYGIFALFISRALKHSLPKQSYLKRIFFSCIMLSVYAITDEIHQAGVPYRDASVWDVVVDAIGGFVGSLVYR